MKRLFALILLAGLLLPGASEAAISYVASGSNFAGETGTTGTSLTYAVATTGADRMLVIFVTVTGDTTDWITGVTYAGVAASRIASATGNGGGASQKFVAMYYLANPALGTNNVVVSASGSVRISSVAAQYSGVDTTSAPNAFAAYNNASGGTTITRSLTTTLNNTWVVIGAGATGGNLNPGTNTTSRGHSGGTIYGDTNAATATGDTSMSIGNPAFASLGIVMAAFAPVPEATTNSRKLRGSAISR